MMEKHLSGALSNNEYVLHYQPYYNANTGKMAGMVLRFRLCAMDIMAVTIAEGIETAEV